MFDGSLDSCDDLRSQAAATRQATASQLRIVVGGASFQRTSRAMAGGFEAALQLLAHNPERWPLASECDAVPFEIREMTYGLGRHKTHRAVFEIRQQEVIVYAIRHLAQDLLTSDDV